MAVLGMQCEDHGALRLGEYLAEVLPVVAGVTAAHLVIVIQEQSADAAAREHLSCNTAYASDHLLWPPSSPGWPDSCGQCPCAAAPIRRLYGLESTTSELISATRSLPRCHRQSSSERLRSPTATPLVCTDLLSLAEQCRGTECADRVCSTASAGR